MISASPWHLRRKLDQLSRVAWDCTMSQGPALGLPCLLQTSVLQTLEEGQMGKTFTALPSNTPWREHPLFSTLALMGHTQLPTQVLLAWLDCSGLQSAASFADCTTLNSGWTPAPDDSSTSHWRRTLEREKQTTTGFDLVLLPNPSHEMVLAPCSSLSAWPSHSMTVH